MTTSYQRTFPTAAANLPRPITRQITPDEVLELRGYMRGLKPSGVPIEMQVDFGKRWGRSNETIHRWETGKQVVPARISDNMIKELDRLRKKFGTG